jgi:hypothetical protein
MKKWQDPPAEPNCANADPIMFDDKLFYGMALAYCETCPVRAWCLSWVDPARNWYDGVVGGHVWQNGEPQPQYKRTGNDTVLQVYLARSAPRSRNKDLDHVAIREFIVGRMPWNRLSKAERAEAARTMARMGGYSRELAADLTHLPSNVIDDIFDESERNQNK